MLHCWKYVFIISIAVAFFHNVVEEVIAMHFGFVFLVIDTKLNQAYFLQGINKVAYILKLNTFVMFLKIHSPLAYVFKKSKCS